MTGLTAIIHIPGLRLTDGPHGLAGGRLEALAFERWQQIDGSHEYADRKFNRTAPAFWVGPVAADDATPLDVLETISSCIHRAFLLHPVAPALPSPSLSCRYLEHEIDGLGSAWQRVIGPAEREWIVFGGLPVFDCDAAMLAPVDHFAELLKAKAEAPGSPGLRTALDTLERTARPDLRFDGDDGMGDAGGFVELVAAAEALLRENDPSQREGEDAGGGESLAAAFVRRAAAMLGSDAAQIAEFARVYDLRTRLIHGRIAARDLVERDRETLAAGRLLLRNICVARLAA